MSFWGLKVVGRGRCTIHLQNSPGIGILTKKYRENSKNAYFGHLDPFNDFFSQIHPPWNNFSNFLVKIVLTTFPKFSNMTSFLPPKMSEFGTCSHKMTYFDQIDSINDYFDQIYVHKPDPNNCYKLLAKYYLINFVKF